MYYLYKKYLYKDELKAQKERDDITTNVDKLKAEVFKTSNILRDFHKESPQIQLIGITGVGGELALFASTLIHFIRYRKKVAWMGMGIMENLTIPVFKSTLLGTGLSFSAACLYVYHHHYSHKNLTKN